MSKLGTSFLFLLMISFEYSSAYSAIEDAEIVRNYKGKENLIETSHAKVARNLVHQTNWAAVGTISTNTKVLGYPMVNVKSIDDNTAQGVSTGKIRFLLTDLDFTGHDWRQFNKVTFLFTDAQNGNCNSRAVDPMEPTCARAMISGKIIQMDKNSAEYADAIAAFYKRHPSAVLWMKTHSFYLCELDIENIFIVDFYGGAHEVPVEVYYNPVPISNEIYW